MTNIINDLHISFKDTNVKTPMRSTVGSAGFDVFSHRKIVLPAKKAVAIKLPFTFKGSLDPHLEVRLFVRSSFGIKKKLRLADKGDKNINHIVLNTNELNYVINVINDGEKDLIINKGEHFAQFIICEKVMNPQDMSLPPVPEEEAAKYRILKARLDQQENNYFNYVLEEDITLQPFEQRTFATGYRSLINENTWTAITTHKDVKNVVMLANQTGVIDKDYANTSNYGHCFLALVNLLNEEIRLLKGTNLLVWWTEKFYILKNEIKSNSKRKGGIGSTN